MRLTRNLSWDGCRFSLAAEVYHPRPRLLVTFYSVHLSRHIGLKVAGLTTIAPHLMSSSTKSKGRKRGKGTRSSLTSLLSSETFSTLALIHHWLDPHAAMLVSRETKTVGIWPFQSNSGRWIREMAVCVTWLLFPFYRWGNQGSKSLNYMSFVIHLRTLSWKLVDPRFEACIEWTKALVLSTAPWIVCMLKTEHTVFNWTNET